MDREPVGSGDDVSEWPVRKYPRVEFREVTAEDVERMAPTDPAVLDAIEAALVEAIESTAGHALFGQTEEESA